MKRLHPAALVPLAVFAFAAAFSACTGSTKPVPPAGIDSGGLAGPGAHPMTYKTVDGRELEAHVFLPPGYGKDDGGPFAAAAWFHGGAWVEGIPAWGYHWAEHLASRGMVAVSFEYRLADRSGVSVLDSMKDAASAVSWLRTYAEELRIDPDRIMAGGDSAGGHLAVSTMMFPGFRDEGERRSASSVPNLAWGLAPAVAVNDGYFQGLLLGEEEAVNCSPADNVKAGLGPIVIVHGTEDPIVPFRTTVDFSRAMNAAGSETIHLPYPGGDHAFYHADPKGVVFVENAMDEILSDRGFYGE